MAIPSVNTLQTRLGIDRAKALTLRRLLDGRLDPETFASVQAWVRQCYHKPRRSALVMCAANELLGTFGDEPMRGSYLDGYHFDIRYSYLNTGDTYANTLVRDHARSRWLVTSYGHLAETDPALQVED